MASKKKAPVGDTTRTERAKAHLERLENANGKRLLVENAPMDFYWGCGADGSGQNRLGDILMQVRAGLSDQTMSADVSQKRSR